MVHPQIWENPNLLALPEEVVHLAGSNVHPCWSCDYSNTGARNIAAQATGHLASAELYWAAFRTCRKCQVWDLDESKWAIIVNTPSDSRRHALASRRSR